MTDPRAHGDHPVRLVCFDWGGVILRICRSWAEAAHRAGLDPQRGDAVRDASMQARLPIVRDYERGRIDCETFCDRLSAAIGRLYSADEVRAVHDAWLIGEYPGVRTLMEGRNLAYGEPETRSSLKFQATAIGLTVVLLLGMAIALTATLVLPAVMVAVSPSPAVELAAQAVRWPLLALFAIAGIAVLNRYAPDRRPPRWRWVAAGSLLATLVWIGASILFSIYVRQFGSYNATYGALGGVIVLMTWLWLSAFIVLVGAKLNAEMEHQTEADSTRGPDRPRGDRGAAKADGLGRPR